MKAMLVTCLLFGSSLAYAEDSGLNCVMSYSSTDVLSTSTDSDGAWLVAGGQMNGPAVSADGRGGWTSQPAHSIKVEKNRTTWKVTILNDKKTPIGSFSFSEKQGMKATMATEAYMANESEDPPKYDKLEVSCYYTLFVG